MLGLPSPSALRNAAVASIAGAGIALVGLSLTNVAAMDGTLAAATHQPAPIHRTTQVSYVTKRDCPREHRQTSTSLSTAAGRRWSYAQSPVRPPGRC
jgi:hypothetical protein